MEAPKQPSVLLMGLLYAFFSSTMMIFNKGALGVFPFPLQLTSLQYFVSGAAVYVLAHVKVLEAEGLRWGTIRKFWFVSAVFTLAIFSNTRVLHVASVETVIVFRTTVALLTAVGDWIWLGKELPSAQSWAALLSIVAGACGYSYAEGAQLTTESMAWGVIYVLVLAFEMLYVKHVVTEVKMTTWTRVYYNNMISLAFNMPLIISSQLAVQPLVANSGAASLVASVALPAVQNIVAPWGSLISLVMLSALGGLGISYAGFGFRSMVSATTFTLAGIMCKVATVLMSQILFENKASLQGVACLGLCVGGATLYKPSPDRPKPGATTMLPMQIKS
jgi:solute carrier family 35 protein